MDHKIRILIVVTIVIFISGFLVIRYTTDVSALEKVNITMENINIQELHLTYCKLKLKVNISNPTNEYISGLLAEFDISIAGTYVGNGSVPTVSIPAQSQIKRDVILTIYYADVGNAVIDTWRSKRKCSLQPHYCFEIVYRILLAFLKTKRQTRKT